MLKECTKTLHRVAPTKKYKSIALILSWSCVTEHSPPGGAASQSTVPLAEFEAHSAVPPAELHHRAQSPWRSCSRESWSLGQGLLLCFTEHYSSLDVHWSDRASKIKEFPTSIFGSIFYHRMC